MNGDGGYYELELRPTLACWAVHIAQGECSQAPLSGPTGTVNKMWLAGRRLGQPVNTCCCRLASCCDVVSSQPRHQIVLFIISGGFRLRWLLEIMHTLVHN